MLADKAGEFESFSMNGYKTNIHGNLRDEDDEAEASKVLCSYSCHYDSCVRTGGLLSTMTLLKTVRPPRSAFMLLRFSGKNIELY